MKNSKVSELRAGYTESYSVKFWFRSPEGEIQQSEQTFFANSKNAHKLVENYAKKYLGSMHTNVQIVTIKYI